MNAAQYLDAVRAELELPSDYALQKPLELSKSQLSKYRKGQDCFSDAVCRRIATILRIHPGIVALDMQRERAKTDADRSLWKEITEGFWPLVPQANDRRRDCPPGVARA